MVLSEADGKLTGDSPDILRLPIVSVHECPPSSWKWPFGSGRGGTPALFVEEIGEYIVIFHSQHKEDKTSSHYKPLSYFVGALTFSANPPFKLLRVSRVPLFQESWYDGQWFYPIKVAYTVFPMGIMLERKLNGSVTVVVSYDRQDKVGAVFTMGLTDLLNSMTTFEC